MAPLMKTTKSHRPEVFGRVRRSFPRLHRILVPLDFSGKSRQALSFAVPIAEKFAARIVLLHVLPVVKRGTKSEQARRQAAEKRMKDTAAKFRAEALLGEVIVRAGEPAATILRVAGEVNADLISLATDARTGFRRLIKGSTVEQVLRSAPCPVLTMRKR